MIFLCALMVGLLIVTRKQKGPLWALCIAWLVSILPIVTGLIDYTYFSVFDFDYNITLASYLLCFVAGVAAFDHNNPTRLIISAPTITSYHESVRWAVFAWMAAAVGTLCILIDFLFFQGTGLDDLSALRDNIVQAENVSVFAKAGSVLTWGCIYCFGFAIFFRKLLSRKQFIIWLLPVGGYFLTALLSAGRQAAFQILIFSILLQALNKAQQPSKAINIRSHWRLAVGISILMISYMGYVAFARFDTGISADKTEFLATIFEYDFHPDVENYLDYLSAEIKTTVVEAVVYFSSPVTLFSKFREINFEQLSLGAMSFPLLFRQLEPITGTSVIGTLQTKMYLMNSTGAFGAGWTTAISSYIMDFGWAGAALVLFAEGYYTTYAWRRALKTGGFHEALVALILLTLVVYMPLLAASSDTNIFLLWLYCILALAFRKWRSLICKIVVTPEKQLAAQN